MKGDLRLGVSAHYMKWQPTSVSRIQVIVRSTMTILRIFKRPESWLSWPVAAIKVKAWSVGIRIFVESGLEERLIVKTTVRFFDHLVCPFI